MNKQKGSGGISIFSVIGIIFIVLKLLGLTVVSTWSWLWVLSPFWIAFAVWLVIIILGAVFISIFK